VDAAGQILGHHAPLHGLHTHPLQSMAEPAGEEKWVNNNNNNNKISTTLEPSPGSAHGRRRVGRCGGDPVM